MNMIEKFTLADEVIESLLEDRLKAEAEEILLKLTYRSGAEQGDVGYLGYRPNSRRLFCFVANKDYATSFRRHSYNGDTAYLECMINGQPHYLDYKSEGGAIYGNPNRLWSVGWKHQDDTLIIGGSESQPFALCPDYEPVMMPVLYASMRLTPFRVSPVPA